MGDNASKIRSAATPLPIAYSRWPIAVLFPNTQFSMAVAQMMFNAKMRWQVLQEAAPAVARK